MKYSLKKIFKTLNLNNEIKFNKSNKKLFSGVNTLDKSKKFEISFFHNLKYLDDLKKTNAGACFVNKKYSKYLPSTCIPIYTNNPYKIFIYTLNFFNPKRVSTGEISEKSIIGKNVKLGKNVEIQDGAIIKDRVKIGENSIISSNTVIGPNVNISSYVFIDENCSIFNCNIGKSTIIQSGVSIGSSGFGFAIDELQNINMSHLGKVLIGKDVVIGNNSAVARGSLEDTIISDNVRIDNLVHISHNVKIGKNTIIAGQSGIAGSTIIGKNVIMGGQVGISGHLKIGNNVKIAAKSGVIKNIDNNSTVGGYPAVNIKDWHRSTIKLYLNKKK
tara:strand:- start:624 stop:1613 length:990 start_codon:yes stop_codon:yes gene_type:complete